MKNLLVALELEEEDFTQKLLKAAEELAIAFNSKVWLVHITAPEPDFVGYQVGPKYIRDMVAEEMKSEHRLVQSHAKALREKGIDAEGLSIQGPTEKSLLEEVNKLKADLIIMGNKKHGSIYSRLIGSVSEDLLHELEIPAFLIPA